MKTQKYKTTGNRGVFDAQDIYEKLSAIGNPLERISLVIDFEMFRKSLVEGLQNKNKKNNAGARPYDVVMMLKYLYYREITGLATLKLSIRFLID